LLENFRPGVLAQYGLDYAELSRLNPRLVMLSISGYGQRGPRAQHPAYASVMHAETGLMQRQADVYGTRPRDVPVSVADMNAGLHGLSAVLAALYMRERCGHGQHIDIAMTDTMLATDDHVHLALDGEQAERPFAVDVWEVAFGHIVIAGDFRWSFRQLVECSGLVDPTPAHAPLPLKIELRRAALQAFLLSLADRAALGSALDKANLAWGQVQSTRDALNSETAQVRGSVVEVADRAGGKRRVVQSPYRFSAAISGLRGPAPLRGEHNAVVLREWLGADDAEIAQLRAARVLLEEAAVGAAPP
jgi:crotonobetainyl-CoA:carnitine CoA-transferase CaiB-like acyl-CoA transferase